MTQVWLYDKNRVFTESIFVDELGENMTITPLLVGYVKPTLNEQEEWCEGATQEEIKEWEEANKPVEVPSEMEILLGDVRQVSDDILITQDLQLLTHNSVEVVSNDNLTNTDLLLMVLSKMDAMEAKLNSLLLP